MLVLAGPGAGKTFCLIERIRFLIEECEYDPARICAFTFTNRAADEIAERLERRLGTRADRIKRGTIHAFCAELLREFGETIGVPKGFGIADEPYQRSVLRRLEVPERWQRTLLGRFALHRFRGVPLDHRDAARYERYERFLAKRSVVDFDGLVLKTLELFQKAPDVADTIRARWAYVLVDEFQDLNRVQYAVIRALTRDHDKVFAVGDDEQSIYSWAGADRGVFPDLVNDLRLVAPIHLQDNHRCPRDVFALARRLVMWNPPIFEHREHVEAIRESSFPIVARSFETDDDETRWILDDIRRDRDAHGLNWGDFALLYRTHHIGYALEAGFLTAGIPCRLAVGRAFADDPIVAYVIAALRVIAAPNDDAHREGFFSAVLPKALIDQARAGAEERGETVVQRLRGMTRELSRAHGDAQKIRRGLYALRNLAALGARHSSIGPLVEELLSQRVGEYRTVLEEHHDELTDPADDPDVVRVSDQLNDAMEHGWPIWIPRLGGVEIALKGILAGVGLRHVVLGGARPAGSIVVGPEGSDSTHGATAPARMTIALRVFKAAQLVASRSFTNAFGDFTAIDLETTGKNPRQAEIVELAVVRVRNGRIVDELHKLVKPRVPIEPGATRTHGFTAEMLAAEPFFEDVWPEVRAFCGTDILVAHNGYDFDFPILRRMAAALSGGWSFSTYDSLLLARDLVPTSKKLEDLARAFGIDPGHSHRALDDTRTLAQVFPALNAKKVERARTTALVNVLDYLAVGLALADEQSLNVEERVLRERTRGFALGRYSDCLDRYRAERDAARDESLPTADQLIARLGGEELMLRVRADKTADQRYPAAMLRLRRLLAQCPPGPLAGQIESFLERSVLSQYADGADADRERVNLLTLHSTKGLEFSRVYIVGVEDGQLPGRSDRKEPSVDDVEEARRLLYVGMTRTKDRLVMTRVKTRAGKPTGAVQFLDEMGGVDLVAGTGSLSGELSSEGVDGGGT